jgi:hypothetical protein
MGERVCKWRIFEADGKYFVEYKIESDSIADLSEDDSENDSEEDADFIESWQSPEQYETEILTAAAELWEACFVEGYPIEDSTPEYARARAAGGSKKRKNCTKGLACGYTCIPRTRTCRSPLEGQFATHAAWLLAQQPQEAPYPRILTTLPRSVRDVVKSDIVTSPDGDEVVVRTSAYTTFHTVVPEASSSQRPRSINLMTLAFSINGSYFTSDIDKLEPKTAIRATRRAISLFKENLSNIPDGVVFQNSPIRSDAAAEGRVKLYKRLGFGDPDRDNSMYAVSQGGKLRPISNEKLLELANNRATSS